jgi:flagellar biosynthesis GTPase FlhF
MNKNRVIRIVKLVATLIVIALVLVVFNVIIKNSKENLETTDLKSNMLQIQAKGRVLNDKADMNNKIEEERKGNRLSSFKTEEEKKKEAEEAAKKAAEENGENGENAAPVEVPQQEVKKDEKEDPNKEKTLDEIVNDFKKLNVIPESDYDKYYALEDADLEFFGLNFKNEKNARYLINYDTHEVGITCGYQGQYLLSQMGLKD